jgi:phospho-N-acetylmuramoyl-pentapeptide-transferase
MLVWLFEEWLAHDVALFGFITFRTIMAALTAMAVSLVIGPYFIRHMIERQIGQPIRELGPDSHLSKAGTPTMGGTMILIALAISTLLWSDLSNRYVWTVLFVTLAFGGIGFIDDYLKLKHRDSAGLSARSKYLAQSLAALGWRCSCTTRPMCRPTPSCSCRSSRTLPFRWDLLASSF